MQQYFSSINFDYDKDLIDKILLIYIYIEYGKENLADFIVLGTNLYYPPIFVKTLILKKDPTERRNLVNVLVFSKKKYLQINSKCRHFL